MENIARRLDEQLQAKVVDQVELPGARDVKSTHSLEKDQKQVADPDDGFLTGSGAQSWKTDHLRRECSRALSEINELQAEARWHDIVALFHPVAQKLPELVAVGLDGDIRLRLSFALCRAGRHEQSLLCLEPLTAREPQNSLANYNIGYVVLDWFFCAKTERRLIPMKKRADLLKLGHCHLDAARQLRPESVTFCYRQAILYKEIEKKPKRAIPLFKQAIENWKKLSPEEQERYHQQRPKYGKSLYHLASSLLAENQPTDSLALLNELMREDQTFNHVKPFFKQFAMGKVLHKLNRFQESLDHLETSLHLAEKGQPTDFVHELAARNELCLNRPERALKAIGRVAPQRRRPYVSWTEAEALAAVGRQDEAIRVLQRSAEKDRRSKHVSLIRICRIGLTKNDPQFCLDAARRAVRFCVDTYGNPSKEGQFWEAVCCFRLGRIEEARHLVDELERGRFQYPHFGRLLQLVRNSGIEQRDVCQNGSADNNRVDQFNNSGKQS